MSHALSDAPWIGHDLIFVPHNVLLSPVLAEMAAALALGDGARAPVPAELSAARFGL